jgi:hypothetical protein
MPVTDADATDASCAAAARENAGTPATAAPMLPIRKKSRRIASNDVIDSSACSLAIHRRSKPGSKRALRAKN